MECQICNSETKINWGNANIILCESHSNELEKLQKENLPSNKNNDAKLRTVAKIILIVICLSLAAFSLPFVGLSAMVFDSGFSWSLGKAVNLNPTLESVAALRGKFHGGAGLEKR